MSLPVKDFHPWSAVLQVHEHEVVAVHPQSVAANGTISGDRFVALGYHLAPVITAGTHKIHGNDTATGCAVVGIQPKTLTFAAEEDVARVIALHQPDWFRSCLEILVQDFVLAC